MFQLHNVKLQFSSYISGKNSEYQWVWELGLNNSRKYLLCNHFWNSYYINKFSLAFLWFLKVYASNSKRYFFPPLYLWSCQSDKSFRGLRPSRVLLSSRILYLRWTSPCLTSWLNFFHSWEPSRTCTFQECTRIHCVILVFHPTLALITLNKLH